MTNLRRLEYFLAVARERNFTRAAERLHVAQPALSRHVRELEREPASSCAGGARARPARHRHLCHEQDVEPRVVLRSLVFDLSQAPVVHGDAVAIVGESLCTGLSAELAWRALTPSRSLGIDLVARRHDRSPAVDRLLDAADRIAGELGWV